MRYSVHHYGEVAFQAATLDNVNREIARRHQHAEKVCIDLRVEHMLRDEPVPYSNAYHIVDNHEEP